MSKMQNEIKFIVHQGWGEFQTVWLVKYDNGEPYNGYIEKGQVVFEKVKEGTMDADLTPFLRLPFRLSAQMLADALNKAVPVTKQEEIDAELKATKYHLEDMRKLALNSLQQEKGKGKE